MLAVDTERFSDIAWYRRDFADGKSLAELTSLIAPDSGALDEGILLDPDADSLAVWAHPGRPARRVTLNARLRDSRGRYFDAALGQLGFQGWRQLSGRLVPTGPGEAD